MDEKSSAQEIIDEVAKDQKKESEENKNLDIKAIEDKVKKELAAENEAVKDTE